MRLIAGPLIGTVCLFGVATATADELRLDDAMLDRVTAGTLLPEDSFLAILNLGAIGQAAVLLAAGLQQQFDEQQPDATPPAELTAIIGFLNRVGLDRGFDPIPPANGGNGANGANGGNDVNGGEVNNGLQPAGANPIFNVDL